MLVVFIFSCLNLLRQLENLFLKYSNYYNKLLVDFKIVLTVQYDEKVILDFTFLPLIGRKLTKETY